MNAARLRTPYALLTRHFLRQFLENDLIAPEADRSQLLAVVGATLLSLSLFVGVFLSASYVIGPQTPGEASIRSLDDKFFFLALGMIVSALVAASQWDALAIDSRDAAILEPLPVGAGIIRRAKLSAVAILGAAVAVAVNAIPSVVFPWLLVFSFRQMPFLSMIWLMATHAVVTIAAAAIGYLLVLALRETLALVLGLRRFTRVSPWIQGALIVMLGTSLLLPASGRRIAQGGFEGWLALSPPIWFLALYEVSAGGVLADLPRAGITGRAAARDKAATELYLERRGQFPAMARRAGVLYVATFALAVGAYVWRARRLPSLAPAPPPAFRRRWPLGAQLANAVLLRDPSARAGFYFALSAMWRSNTHRLTLACAAATGMAMAMVALSGADAPGAGGLSVRILAMQPLLYGALLVGFRHAIRVPAELRANWGIQLAWRDRGWRFVTGVKCAAVAALVLPALATMLPLFALILGPRLALMHAVLGLAGAILLLETLLLSYDKVPFTCTYLPSENMKALAPLYAIAFLVGASLFARIQQAALQRGSAAGLLLVLAALFAIVRIVSAKHARSLPVDFEEAPVTFQRLGLHS